MDKRQQVTVYIDGRKYVGNPTTGIYREVRK